MSRSWPENTTILIAEDDQATARIIQARLEVEGLKVLIAPNGLGALDILHGEHIDLIVTDLMMPAMNGFRLIQEVRDLPTPVCLTPIIVISSNRNEQDMVRCLAAGANSYIVKPIVAQQLVDRLWELLGQTRGKG